MTLATAVWSWFFQPATMSTSPRIIASNPNLCDLCRVGLLTSTDFRVQHVGALEKLGIGGPIVDRVVSTGYEAGNRSRYQNASVAARPDDVDVIS